ncbi:hypothetical protein M422DRAFT_39537, partial [Sphaerobolus stellatus SS14]
MGSFLSLLQYSTHTETMTALHVSPDPAVLKLQDQSELSLKEFIESRCPSVLKEFIPQWWLFNGHLQTAYCVFGDFSKIDKVIYERTLLQLSDGGTLGLDFTGPGPQETMNPETTILVVMHGLTGGSYESYVRSILSFACASKEHGGLGYRGVVVNFRGCAGVEITSPQFYSAGHTDDLRTAMVYISSKFPKARKIGMGFSLGASVVTRYMGEEGENCKFASGCALACPWDILKNSDHLQNSWLHRTIYSKAMGKNLKKLFLGYKDVVLKGAEHLRPYIEKVENISSPRLIDVDETLTRFLGGSSPPFPFPTTTDYYKWASSHPHIKKIRVPFLALSDMDDPVVQAIPLPVPEEA